MEINGLLEIERNFLGCLRNVGNHTTADSVQVLFDEVRRLRKVEDAAFTLKFFVGGAPRSDDVRHLLDTLYANPRPEAKS